MSDYDGMFEGFGGSGSFEIVHQRKRQREHEHQKRGPAVTGAPVILLSANTFTQNSAQATAIGTLSVSAGTGTYTFTLTATSGSKFQVGGADGSSLQCGVNPAVAGSYTVTVRADNGAGSVISQNFILVAIAVVSFVPTYELLGF